MAKKETVRLNAAVVAARDDLFATLRQAGHDEAIGSDKASNAFASVLIGIAKASDEGIPGIVWPEGWNKNAPGNAEETPGSVAYAQFVAGAEEAVAEDGVKWKPSCSEADGVKAMVDVVSVPVTVKHRIGIDKNEDYGFVRDFVGQVSEAGCQVFIVHARNAWLKGLSPKANREVPPLRYATVRRLKADFPHLVFVLNGGITTEVQIAEQLQQLDGVMLGREAYHNPWLMANWDERFFDQPAPAAERERVEQQMVDYMAREARARYTVELDRPAHARAAPRAAGCTALAPGLERSSPARCCATGGDAPGTCGCAHAGRVSGSAACLRRTRIIRSSNSHSR